VGVQILHLPPLKGDIMGVFRAETGVMGETTLTFQTASYLDKTLEEVILKEMTSLIRESMKKYIEEHMQSKINEAVENVAKGLSLSIIQETIREEMQKLVKPSFVPYTNPLTPNTAPYIPTYPIVCNDTTNGK
jgi:hypothetical protein